MARNKIALIGSGNIGGTLALLSGINPERVVIVTWIIASTLVTIAGVLYGLDKSFKPFTYFNLLLTMFI